MMYAPNRRYLDRKPSSGLDVLAPTWFSVSGAKDAIAVRADKDYVRWAHANGYKVWALFANKFDDIAGTSELMCDPARRQAVIEAMLAHVRRFGLDGINLDFENMRRKDSGCYTQFVREFAAVLRPEGLVLSVDVSVPGRSDTWSRCFDRKALAESADCIFLMAYDQHYAGSRESGSTAEIGWVEALALKYDLAGVGAWSLNYADDRDGDIIGRNLKETADYGTWLSTWGQEPRCEPLAGK